MKGKEETLKGLALMEKNFKCKPLKLFQFMFNHYESINIVAILLIICYTVKGTIV